MLKKEMMNRCKFWLSRLLHYDSFVRRSWSQEGEDILLSRLFEGKEQGFYVDVGAHHPRRFSNTQYFYRRGWRGINIEPNPEAAKAFRIERPGDINLQTAISDVPGKLTYYVFDEPALNTFDAVLAQSRLKETSYRLLRETEIPVVRLDALLDLHLPAGTSIDFMSIDVEGLDLQVLHSNNWVKYRPQCVLVEALGSANLMEVMSGELHQLMEAHQYALFAKTYNTLFYIDNLLIGAKS
jgi:FkbM family methyltransferase